MCRRGAPSRRTRVDSRARTGGTMGRRIRTGSRWTRATVAGTLALVCGLAAAPAAAADTPAASDPALAPADSAGAPPVAWGTCPADLLGSLPEGDNGRYSCATYQVPLDYRHPRGATVGIAMLRRAAADPAHRIGSLFFNPG